MHSNEQQIKGQDCVNKNQAFTVCYFQLIDLQEVGSGSMEWIDLAQVGTCKCGIESSGSRECREFLD